MANEKTPISTAKAREAASVIQWHPGFCCAVKFELREDRDALEFDTEYEVSRGPLVLDLLVIKKRDEIHTANEIGKIFRRYNVCEFKSPGDSLTIDDYFKVVSYAGLIKSSGATVNEIPAREITLTFIRHSYPREMVRELTESGASVTEAYPGMYYLERGEDGKGDVFFPTQIIVTGELDKAKHSTLRVLTNNADEADIRLFLEEALSEDGKEDRNNVDAVLQVSVSANAELYERIRRDDRMCQALRELMKDEIREELDKAERQGGISCAVAIYRDELGMDDQTIISRIIPRFNLTREQAKAYVIPQGM